MAAAHIPGVCVRRAVLVVTTMLAVVAAACSPPMGPTPTTTPAPALSGATEVAAGLDFTCAIVRDGLVVCWGSNAKGQLGDGTNIRRLAPTPVVGIDDAVQVEAGDDFACALRRNGKVGCWGSRRTGQLGDGGGLPDCSEPEASCTDPESTTPRDVVGVTDATQIAAGRSHACARLRDGSVRCWGNNNRGELGGVTVAGASTLPLIPIGLDGSVVHLVAGGEHTCAIQSQGTVRCWGANDAGQLGSGSTSTSSPPVAVAGLAGALRLSADRRATCATISTGTLFRTETRCWGENARGQLGDGSLERSTTPSTVAGLDDASDVDGGHQHTCALRYTGEVRCWGANIYGELGDGTKDERPLPVDVRGVAGATRVSSGFGHSCAVVLAGQVQCWGDNSFGQLGNGRADLGSPTPITVTAPTSLPLTPPTEPPAPVSLVAEPVSTGIDHSCAVLGGGLRCWGFNSSGQLGDGTTTSAQSPTIVDGIGGSGSLGGVVQVSAGATHTCAVLATRQVACWGNNGGGKLGDGTTTNRRSPALVRDVGGGGTLGNVVQVSVGSAHTCAVLGDGRVACWGNNATGALGAGLAVSSSNVPVAVVGMADAAQVAAGVDHSCALRRDRTVSCWGSDVQGQLGSGVGPGDSPTPVAVVDESGATGTRLAGVSQVSTRGFHTCAALLSGQARCWGVGPNGELGDGTTDGSGFPVAVVGLDNVVQIDADLNHSCALLDDSTARCWGNGANGRLGNGTNASALIPVPVSGLGDATHVSAGGAHSCASRSGGSLSCWGSDLWGQLGNGAGTGGSSVPVPVIGA
jgi:alpha-tubulin suppressor-like RCC1 family protein